MIIAFIQLKVIIDSQVLLFNTILDFCWNPSYDQLILLFAIESMNLNNSIKAYAENLTDNYDSKLAAKLSAEKLIRFLPPEIIEQSIATKTQFNLSNFISRIKMMQLSNYFFGMNLSLKTATKWLFSTIKANQTIYALSTGVNSAISIVRVSGPHAFQVLSLLSATNDLPNLQKKQLLSSYKIVPKMMSLRKLFGRQTGLIDQCLVVYFESEHSYTGEDMFQLHVHGSKAIVSALFNQLAKLNFRMANRGEFTRRSVLNNRLTLQQAEAINDLVNSQLQFQRQVAIHNLLGKNKAYLDELRNDLISVLAQIEAYIQFEEEEIGSQVLSQALAMIEKLSLKIEQVIQSSQRLQSAKDGVKISIIGRPNVGKSTLMNQLLRKDVSIVSSQAGTTRDLIESEMDLQGFRVKFVDTAGIRDSLCQVEQQGIKRTKRSIEQSEIVLILFDLSLGCWRQQQNQLVIEPHEEQLKLLDRQNKIIIANKCDTLRQQLLQKEIVLKANNQIYSIDCAISLKETNGVQAVKKVLLEKVNKKFYIHSQNSSVVYFTRARYIQGLRKCSELLRECKKDKYADLMSQKIRMAIEQVEQMVGRVDNEQILDNIFTNFCIGK